MQKYEYSNVDELIAYLFDGQPHLLAAPMAAWLNSSRRFAAFATTFRDKIRKKLRVTQDEETLYDLQLELETAYRLLQEKTLSLVYEPSRQVRSPDFAVTYTTSLTFMVEVTRLRAIQERTSPDLESTLAADPSLAMERLADTICSKLGQFLPQRSNVLIAGADIPSLTQNEFKSAMLRIQQRAERNDSSFLRRYGFQDRASFFNTYYRLSEVLVRSPRAKTDHPLVVWVNPQAKYPLPGKVRTVLYRSHTL